MCTQKKSLLRVLVFVFILITICFIKQGFSQESYPNRTITVIDPWGPGMSNTITRIICKAAEKELGQPIIIESKPGAAGVIAMNYVLKSKPDGYTLGTPMTSAYTNLPHIRKAPYIHLILLILQQFFNTLLD